MLTCRDVHSSHYVFTQCWGDAKFHDGFWVEKTGITDTISLIIDRMRRAYPKAKLLRAEMYSNG